MLPLASIKKKRCWGLISTCVRQNNIFWSFVYVFRRKTHKSRMRRAICQEPPTTALGDKFLPYYPYSILVCNIRRHDKYTLLNLGWPPGTGAEPNILFQRSSELMNRQRRYRSVPHPEKNVHRKRMNIFKPDLNHRDGCINNADPDAFYCFLLLDFVHHPSLPLLRLEETPNLSKTCYTHTTPKYSGKNVETYKCYLSSTVPSCGGGSTLSYVGTKKNNATSSFTPCTKRESYWAEGFVNLVLKVRSLCHISPPFALFSGAPVSWFSRNLQPLPCPHPCAFLLPPACKLSSLWEGQEQHTLLLDASALRPF